MGVIDLKEKAPKHLAIRMSKMLEGRDYATVMETIALLTGATVLAAGYAMGKENAENFRKDLLSTIEDHSAI